MRRNELEEVVLASFRGEIDALKPGNVSRYAGGHGMSYQDFIQSAEAVVPILCHCDYSVGERILESVVATREVAGCNTNLGMLLLYAPLIKAFEVSVDSRDLRRSLVTTLAALQHADTEAIFAAIRLANPAGLGQVAQYDVHSTTEADIITVMQAAADRDLIAREYVTGFEIVCTTGFECLGDFGRRWNSVEWAAVACYMTILANFPDSHIRRKFGIEAAERVRAQSVPMLKRLQKNKKPDSAIPMLLAYDKELKESKLNPGACADLTAASLLFYNLST
ncbi:MAG: triphosphoribosyl-dephospho-CoA synthase [Gammaproteobacteria bacterium]